MQGIMPFFTTIWIRAILISKRLGCDSRRKEAGGRGVAKAFIALLGV
jgi:hypothetical protein